MGKKIGTKFLSKLVLAFFFLSLNSANIFCGLLQNITPKEPEVIDWDKIKRAYINFLACPMDEGGTKLFLASLPEAKRPEERGNKKGFIDLMFGYFIGSDTILWNEIRAGNRPATEAAFRLLSLLDDENLDSFKEVLSHLIRLKPEMFIEFCNKYRDSSYIKQNGYPVDFFMESYRLVPGAQLYELEKRIEVLNLVKETPYEEVKRDCIAKLHDKILRIKGDARLREESLQIVSEINEAAEKAGLGDKRILESFVNLVQYPSPGNGRSFIEAITDKSAGAEPRGLGKFCGFIVMDSPAYSMIYYEAMARNEWAARAMLQFLKYSDGGMAEMLEGDLSNLIRFAPETFLSAYKKEKDLLSEYIKDNLIGYPALEYWEGLPDLPLPPGYTDRIYECLVNDMIKKLEEVENPELKDIRDYCLERLR